HYRARRRLLGRAHVPLTQRRGPDNDLGRRVLVHAIFAVLFFVLKAHPAAALPIPPVEALAAVGALTNRAHLGSVNHLARHCLMRLARGGNFRRSGSSSLHSLASTPPALHGYLLQGGSSSGLLSLRHGSWSLGGLVLLACHRSILSAQCFC